MDVNNIAERGKDAAVSVMTKAKNLLKQAERSPKPVNVKNLSFYPTDDPKSSLFGDVNWSDYHYVPRPPLPMEGGVKVLRIAVTDAYASASERFDFIKHAQTRARSLLTRLQAEQQQPYTTAKAVSIVIGGLGGFVLGSRRGGGVFRQAVYSAAGMTTVAAFCYPNEAIDIGRLGATRAQQTWQQFQASPQPPEVNKEKDIDMYTTRSQKIN